MHFITADDIIVRASKLSNNDVVNNSNSASVDDNDDHTTSVCSNGLDRLCITTTPAQGVLLPPRHSVSSNDICVDASTGSSNDSSAGMKSSSSSNSVCSDHPLNLSPDSEWVSFFKDNEVLGQIDKDVR